MEITKYNIRNKVSTPATSEFKATPSKILHQAAFDAYEAYHSNMEKLKIAIKSKKSFGKKKRKKKKKKKNEKTEIGKIKRKRHNRKNKARRQHEKAQIHDHKFKKKPFRLKFKSSTRKTDSIGFQKCGVSFIDETTVTLFPKTMKDRLKITTYTGNASQDPRICRVYGRYYLCFPEKVEGMPLHEGVNREVAIDPGVRKFMAYYSPSGTSGFIGQGSATQSSVKGSRGFIRKTRQEINKSTGFCGNNSDIFLGERKSKKVGTGMYRQMDIYFARYNRIRKDIRDLDDMYASFSVPEKSATRKWYKKKKYSLRKAWHRLMSRASSRMDDFHWKSAQFLLENFDTVYIPKFQVQNMTRRGNLNVKTRKRMLYQRHFSFRQKLKHRANILGKTVIEGSEWGTTKCCGVCGLRNDPGSSEVYSCSGCSVRNVERDLHGARNYYIKEKSRIKDCVDKEVYKFVKSDVLGVVDVVLNSICSGTAITVRK